MNLSTTFLAGAMSVVLTMAVWEMKNDKLLDTKQKIYIAIALWCAMLICAAILVLWSLTLDFAYFTIGTECIGCDMDYGMKMAEFMSLFPL